MELFTQYQCTSLHANYPSVLLTWEKVGGKQEGIYSSYFIYFYNVGGLTVSICHFYNKTPPGRNEAKEGERAVSISERGFKGGP